jgi:hypothetical protein
MLRPRLGVGQKNSPDMPTEAPSREARALAKDMHASLRDPRPIQTNAVGLTIGIQHLRPRSGAIDLQANVPLGKGMGSALLIALLKM